MSWKPKRQDVKVVALSSAEFVSFSRAMQHAVSLCALLFELGASEHDFTIIYEVNLSSSRYVVNLRSDFLYEDKTSETLRSKYA